MKKTNKILGGLFAVLLVGTFAARSVKAEVLNGLGSDGKDATVQGIFDADVYSVDITWGSMQYTYSKVSTDNYAWNPNFDGYRSSAYVDITNNSTKSIQATLSWESAISGVTATFNNSTRQQGNGTCEDAFGLIYTTDAWSDQGTSGVYRLSQEREKIIYTDNTCETYVEAGTAFDENTTYYAVYFDNLTEEMNSNTATISEPVLYENADFDVVGGWYRQEGRPLATTAIFGMELTGGNVDDVKAAYNTVAKKVGTVTVTITDAE